MVLRKVRSRGLLLAALLALCLSAAPVRAQGEKDDVGAGEERAFKQAASLVAPSLVRIETVGGLEKVEQFLTSTGPTTGLVVSDDGYIVTSAFNFVSKPASILVTLADGRRLPATQVAIDRVKMLALVKVEAQNLVPPQVAPRESFRVGQWALALGRTLDDAPSVSVGIVSALGRIWGKAIQTDAKVSPVNYGGALVDLEGRVIGVLVPLSPQATGDVAGVEWYDSGIGFAIPLADIYATLDRLKSGKDLFPGLMGITMKGQDIYEGQPTVDRVRYGSPAQVAGLKEGDLILELDGNRLLRQAQLRHVMGSRYAGETISVRFKRGEEQIASEMTLVDKLIPYESAWLGIAPVRPDAAHAAEAGVGIRFAFPGGPASLAELKRGERIFSFNGQILASSTALLDLVSRQRPGDKAQLVVAEAAGEGARGKERTVELTLTGIPARVPGDVRAAPMTPRDKELADKSLSLGHFTEKMPAHEREYWAYVPEDYNPDYKYSLLVWLHPSGDTMEAAILRAWQSLCDERGIILLAPKAGQIQGWDPDEIEFISDAIGEITSKYSIDKARVAVHAFGTSGPMAYATAFKHRGLIHGIAAVAAPLTFPPPDNEPDFRLQFHLTSGENDPVHKLIIGAAKALREMKYPVIHTTVPEGTHKYPPAEIVTQIATWVDLLDQI